MDADEPFSLNGRKADTKPLVLVVDDDTAHQKMMGLLAERLGFTAYAAGSCEEALLALTMNSFDAILMDYRMPKVDGCHCAEKIRQMKEINHELPIIGVSAHIVEGVPEMCAEAGMNDLLAKPFTIDELRAVLSRWLPKTM